VLIKESPNASSDSIHLCLQLGDGHLASRARALLFAPCSPPGTAAIKHTLASLLRVLAPFQSQCVLFQFYSHHSVPSPSLCSPHAGECELRLRPHRSRVGPREFVHPLWEGG
jgi:hypothetical protein